MQFGAHRLRYPPLCRSFSFDDLDDMVSSGNRKGRGHREDFTGQMAPGSALRGHLTSSQVSPAAQPGRTAYENEQMRMAAASR